MWWLTKLCFEICLISVVSAKNPLNPCKSSSSVNGLDFVSWVEKSQQIPLETRKDEKDFVFFDHNNDELGDWVDYKFVPGMINGNPSIELLLAGRDVDAGVFSTENLLRLVSKSRKTIVLFSGNFCDTLICRFLLTALQELQHSAGRDQLMLVEWHGEVAARVPELIQRTFNRKIYDFLRFESSNDDEVMFFETLRSENCVCQKNKTR
ncbi:uncharacterized protein LOC143465090 isoform X2 [Clavelina lepadiformis]|uniref:uncharacterized protein LOC143465090 isoform X2 n=1 Tax=Clavelina lepadiformis TaxID=159417 RepID=UPI004040EE73